MTRIVSLDRLVFQAFIVSLCLQWLSLGTIAGLQIRWSYPIGLLFGFILLWKGLGVADLPLLVRRTSPYFFMAIYGMTLFLILANLVWSPSAISLAVLLRMLINVGMALLVCAYVHHTIAAERPPFVWLGIVAVPVTTLVLFSASIAAGRDPVAATIQAVTTGNSDAMVFGVFGNAFKDADTGVEKANFRHGIAISMIVVLHLTLLPSAVRLTGLQKLISSLGALAAAGWIVVSFSRASWLAAAVPILIVLVRPFISKVSRLNAFSVIASVAFVSALAISSGALNAVTSRLFSTASYSGRFNHYATSFEMMPGRLLLGGPPHDFRNSHNVVVDMWIATGVGGSVAALLLLVSASRLMWRGTRRALRPGRISPLALALVGTSAVPVVRMLTSGNPTMQIAEWSAFGISLALGYHLVHRPLVDTDADRSRLPELPPQRRKEADREASVNSL